MEIARQCGFATPDVALIPEIPGAIAVKRYDRVLLGEDGLLRLHQEDFCQARGLPLYLKYADAHPEVSYVQVGCCSTILLGTRTTILRITPFSIARTGSIARWLPCTI